MFKLHGYTVLFYFAVVCCGYLVTCQLDTSSAPSNLTLKPVQNMTNQEAGRAITIEIKLKPGETLDDEKRRKIRLAIINRLNKRKQLQTLNTTFDPNYIETTTYIETNAVFTSAGTTEDTSPIKLTTVTAQAETRDSEPLPSRPPPQRRRRDVSGLTSTAKRDYTEDDISFGLQDPEEKDGTYRLVLYGTVEAGEGEINLDDLYEVAKELWDEKTLEKDANLEPDAIKKIYKGLPDEPVVARASHFSFWLPLLICILLLLIILALICLVCARKVQRRRVPREKIPEEPGNTNESPLIKKKPQPLTGASPPFVKNGRGPRLLDDDSGWIVPFEQAPDWGGSATTDNTKL